MQLLDKIILYDRLKIEDSRGYFLKVITGFESHFSIDTCEVYLTMAYPGESKGGHFHPLANEWFTLLEGECVLKLVDVLTKEVHEIYLDSAKPMTVYVPSGIAHSFCNMSDSQSFLLLAFTDRQYDSSDTISYNL